MKPIQARPGSTRDVRGAGMTRVISLHLAAALDAALRAAKEEKSEPTGVPQELRKVLTLYGLEPTPLFSDCGKAGTDCIWHMRCPAAKADTIVSELLLIPGVEGAYIKPP
jgi:hypothetical protein